MQILQMKVKFSTDNREKCLFLPTINRNPRYSRGINIGSIIHDIPEGDKDCFNHLRHNTNNPYNIFGDMDFFEFSQHGFTQLQGKIKKKYPNIHS